MKNFLLDTWPYLLLTHHNDLAVGLQSRSGAGSKGLFALGEDTQRIFGVIAVVMAAVKISQRQK